MATSYKVMLSVPLLILTATQGHCSEPDQTGATLVSSIRGIGQALECISDSTQDGMRLQRESTGALRDVVITISQEIQDLQKKIVSDSEKIQEMNKRFMELQQHVELLEETMSQLNDTVKNHKKGGCELTAFGRHRQEIEGLVSKFRRNSNWNSLVSGLGAVLDHNDGVYLELKDIAYTNQPMFTIGLNGCTQLVLLLLCAGLPADFTDGDYDTMLHGAAAGGKLELLKILVQNGALAYMRDDISELIAWARIGKYHDVMAYLEQLSH